MLAALLGRFGRDRSGSLAMAFSLALPVLGIAVAGAMDLNTWYTAKTRLQVAADGAALASAREMQLASSTSGSVARAAESYVRGQLAGHGPNPTQISATSSTTSRSVQVEVSAEVSPIFSRFLYDGLRLISARATARLSTAAPICVLGLDEAMTGTLHFEKKAQLTANRCGVYSNSLSRSGLQGEDSATLTAQLFCTAGGYSGQRANFSPTPVTDCPQIKDPLANRPMPSVGGCTSTNLVIDKKATVSLSPGTYCGGLKITDKSTVTLAPGIYIIKGGALTVDKKSSLTGQNVGLFFAGDSASLLFDKDSTISLTAPRDGVMSGILMSEEKQVSSPVTAPLPLPDLLGLLTVSPPTLPIGAPKMREYRIVSDDARMLLGTIYLPSGRLMIDSSKPVADRSAYTVIVVRRLDLFDGPNLYLNSDYAATDVPVPDGVGPLPSNVSLIQ